MEALLSPYITNQPLWIQLGLQGFLYGVFGWLQEKCENEEPLTTPSSLDVFMERADEQFVSWPTDWFRPIFDGIILVWSASEKSLVTIERFSEEAEEIFRNRVPADLLVFHQLITGEPITDEQWERLWSALAFAPPPVPLGKQKHTRRIHGKRALTPMKRHKKYRSITLHKRTQVVVVTKEPSVSV